MRFNNSRRKITTFRKKLPLPHAWHICLDLRRLDRACQYHLNKATTQAEKEEIYAELVDYEREPLVDQREAIASRRLLRRAEQLHLDVGLKNLENNVEKKWSPYIGDTSGYYLTPMGFSKVRAAIGDERKARNAAWAELRAWLTLIFALLGAVAGMFSAWTKFVTN